MRACRSGFTGRTVLVSTCNVHAECPKITTITWSLHHKCTGFDDQTNLHDQDSRNGGQDLNCLTMTPLALRLAHINDEMKGDLNDGESLQIECLNLLIFSFTKSFYQNK